MEPKSGFLSLLEFFHLQQPGLPGSPEYNAAFCRILVKAASADQASIWQLDNQRYLHLIYSTDIPPDRILDITLREGEGIIGAAALSRQVIAVAEVRAHAQHDHRVDERFGYQTHSMVSAPILFGDILYGVVNILNHSSGRAFPYEWKDWLAAIGVIYAAALAGSGRLCSYEAPAKKDRDQKRQPARSFEGKTVIVGISGVVREALHLCLKAASANLPVLICGETGTGKELAARRIHEAGDRSHGPFLAVNCAALTETLLESELFGHVKGAFTGAIRDRQGKFVAASGGTLFLDEIGDMSKASQAKILRALEEKKVTPVGSEKAVPCDARIIAATNQILAQRVEKGKFREDLYYRLSGIEILMPPLRERVEDIYLLAAHFLQKAAAEGGEQKKLTRPLRLSKDALEMLITFTWPGNVRQLEQALLAAAAICEGEEIKPGDFPPWLQKAMKSDVKGPAPQSLISDQPDKPLAAHEPAEVPNEERARYLKALETTKYPGTGRWNLNAAARALNMPRKTLTYRLKKIKLIP